MGKIETRLDLLAKAIRHRRRQLGFTQEELAETIDIGAKSYAHIEQGVRRPSIEILLKIADALKMDVVLIARRSGDRPAKKIESI